jgi:hypothetical protein
MIGDGDYEATGGKKIGKGNWSTWRNPAPALFVQHKSHMTRTALEPGPPQWDANN